MAQHHCHLVPKDGVCPCPVLMIFIKKKRKLQQHVAKLDDINMDVDVMLSLYICVSQCVF